MNNNSTWSW